MSTPAPGRNVLLEEALPRIRESARFFALRVPLHLRDEAVDELLVRAVEIADTWEPGGGQSFANFVCNRLGWALTDWMREQKHWARGSSRIPRLVQLDAEYVDLESPRSGLQRRLEVLEAIRLLGRLPARERVALTAPTLASAQEQLGVNEGRVFYLRYRAGERLVELGAAELLGLGT